MFKLPLHDSSRKYAANSVPHRDATQLHFAVSLKPLENVTVMAGSGQMDKDVAFEREGHRFETSHHRSTYPFGSPFWPRPPS